jgi:dipeptidyl aminopeptidase/acylaminoacyl peptidase
MGPYLFQRAPGMGLGTDGWGWEGAPIVRARNADVYVVQRMDAAHFPNLFLTRDFKTFTQLTDTHPEKAYNWLNDELIELEVPKFGKSQGVLYKPENFDPSRKYPVIIYFYEQLSQELHRYLAPDWSGGPLAISTEVSRGYLVFVPDIHYVNGKACKSAAEFIASAAEYLGKLPWIDANKIGIEGHSYGGYEVNCAVSYSGKFAAAVSASGVSDMFSFNGVPDDGSGSDRHEFWQYRMGESMWRDLDGYIEASPALRADRVNTPLLLLSDKDDQQVPWTQGLEMFTALRRLGKPAWLLQYDRGGHGVGGADGQDFSVRMDQFFDHYLKDAPPPKWMTLGVPARRKGIDSGLELDAIDAVP